MRRRPQGRRPSRDGDRMSFTQWYLRRGRIDRRTYWLHYVLPLAVLGILAFLADLALGNVDYNASATSDSASASFQVGWVSVIVFLLTIVPSVSSEVTRLHDRN